MIAVIDTGFSPYHYDFAASRMPQAKTKDRSDDLPLTKSPDTWLPGFPKRSGFEGFTALPVSLPTDRTDKPEDLYNKDKALWAGVQPSNPDGVNYYWLPGTKVIGAMTFGPAPFDRYNPTGVVPRTGGGKIYDTSNHMQAHGVGTTSASVGNIYGACPECLLVFIQYIDPAAAEWAIDWAMRQPWIDAISNSYGFSTTFAGRDRVYNGSDTALQRAASERGQTIFFSAGNGMDNAFTAPNTTLLSSQEGPDWVVTVTATAPNGGAYTGTGKPADVAGIGFEYPSAYAAQDVEGHKWFSGTSNATPTVAGTYARALYFARRALPGDSTVQSGGLIAKGRFTCGRVLRACELAGGLTATELRFRLLRSAVSTGRGFTDGPTSSLPPTPRQADAHYAAEGHGTYAVRLRPDDWRAEFDRVWKPMVGLAEPPARPDGEAAWFVVDSWCRQRIWGTWSGGYYRSGMPLPPDDPARPALKAYRNACANLQAPPP